MIPKEAIEAALNEWSRPNDRREPHEIMEAALTAAFAAMSEPVAWGAWSNFEQRVIAATTDKIKADAYDGRGDIDIFPLYAVPQPAAENDRLRAAITAYVCSVNGEPEKDIWDTEDGTPSEGADRSSSDWAWKEYDDRKQAAFDALVAALERT